MTRILLTVLLVNLGSLTLGQVINGTVKDRESGEPIGYASLFFDGTFEGTTTDEKGRFEMDVTKYRSRPLIISAVGYFSGEITEFSSEKPFLVMLNPRIFEIEEVSVSAESLLKKRKRCMDVFRMEFIGTTLNARRCYILNEEDITFNYGSDRDTLKAYASKPIRVQNLALGYELTYHLDLFEYDRNSGNLSFNGNIIFNRDLKQDDFKDKYLDRKRRRAYVGSRMHFFRTIWNNDLVYSPFSVKDSTNEELDYSQIVVKDEMGRSYLHCSSTLDIFYYSFKSSITPLKCDTYFEEDGFFDPGAVRWGGRMSFQRIADWLPYEYQPSGY